MLPNLAVLEKKCAALGLTITQKGKRRSKDDCVQVLREYYLKKDFPNGLPYTEIEPMLCFAEWNLKPEEAEQIWNSPNWVAQEKLNGCRCILHFIKGVGVFAQTRNISLKTYMRQNVTDRLLFRDMVPEFSASVDTEIMIEVPVDTRGYGTGKDKGVVTQSSLHSTSAVLALEGNQARKLQKEKNAPFKLKTFDILHWEGRDTKGEPLEIRRKFLEIFRTHLNSTAPDTAQYFEYPPFVVLAKKKFFEEVKARGGEGVILKNLRALYEANTSRLRTGWVKAKKRKEYDCFVTGFIRGEEDGAYQNLVGALEFSILLDNGQPHPLAMCSNMTLEFRQSISEYDQATDTVKLKKDVYDKVAQVSGQDITARVLRLSHATLDRWRDQPGDEKTKEECKTTLKELHDASEWVG